MNLCFAEDEFTRELQEDKGEAIWQARLSDGSVVTMDDSRPGEEISSAWIRLGHYIRSTGLRIEHLWLKFRSNVVLHALPWKASAYFFSKNVISELNSGAPTQTFYLVGYLNDDGGVVVEKWAVPALISVQREVRLLSDIKPEQLIRNPECEIGTVTP